MLFPQRCTVFQKTIVVDVFADVLQNAKHRANVASNDVNRPRPGPGPPHEKRALPHRAEIDKTHGAQHGAKLTIDYTDYARNEGKAFHLVFRTACDYLVCRKTI